MPRNSSGTCSKALPDFIAGDDIRATDANNVNDDFVSMLTDSLSRSGKGGLQANMDAGGFRITNLQAGNASGHAVEYDQFNALSTIVTTSKANSGANTDITSLNSPALGSATATTQPPGDNTTKVGTTAFVKEAVDALGAALNASNLTSGTVPQARLTGTFGTTGTAPFFAPRAWVNFDGTRDTTNTVSTANTDRLIKASGNVTKVTRQSLGKYRIEFTTPMPDASFAVLATRSGSTGGSYILSGVPGMKSTTNVDVQNVRADVGLNDDDDCNVVILR